MSLLRPDIRGKLYVGRIPKLGFKRTADSIASDGVVDSVAFTDSQSAEGNYAGSMIYRPAAAAANQLREAGDVSSTKLLQVGLAYSGDSSFKDYEVVGRLHPDKLNDCIRRAQRRVYFETRTSQTVWTDGDFASAQVDGTSGSYDWTSAASGTVPSKSSAAGINEVGLRNLLLTGAGYVLSSSFYVNPGDRFFHGAASKVSGDYTSTYSLIDVTNGNVDIGDPITHSSRTLQTFYRADSIPDGCYEVRIKMQTSGGIATWDTTFSHLAGEETGEFTLPSWITDRWRLYSYGPSDYGRAVGTNRYNSSSRRVFDWKMGVDYQMLPLTEEANPYVIQVERDGGLEEKPYWIYGMRPFSDICDMTDETTPTNAPEDLLIAACEYEICDLLYYDSEDPLWGQLRASADKQLAAQRKARGEKIQRREKSVYVVGGRSGMR